MSTLATLTALPPMQSEEPMHHSTHIPLSSFLPSIQGQGPIASALRILVKLRSQSWVPSFVTDFLGRERLNGKKKDEELKGRAVKVIDLLQHAAELGHTDALYTLGQVSLVSTILSCISIHVQTHRPLVPTKFILPCGSLNSIRVLPHARTDYRQCFITSCRRLLLQYRIPRGCAS